MKKSTYPGLSHLCGAYLHQDCLLDGHTWEEVVRDFAEQSANTRLLDTISDIDGLLGRTQDDDEIWAILDQETSLHIDVRGGGWSLAAWLRRIREVICEQLQLRQELGIPLNEWEQPEEDGTP
jgi:hypothetical protein